MMLINLAVDEKEYYHRTHCSVLPHHFPFGMLPPEEKQMQYLSEMAAVLLINQ